MAAVTVNLRTVSFNMLLLLTSILAAASAATTNQPNIVLIVADDLVSEMGELGQLIEK